MENAQQEAPKRRQVLNSSLGGGPKGLGDPDNKSLRKIEKDVLITKIVRERSRTEKCVEEVKAFSECAKNSGLLLPFMCRQENKALISCLERWFYDEEFVAECTKQYLDRRSEYRRTGIPQKEPWTKQPQNVSE